MSEGIKKFTERDTMRTGWSFDCVVEMTGSNKPGRGGLVLKNVRHQGYNYAKEIRVIGLRMEYVLHEAKKKAERKNVFFELNKNDFEVSDIEILTPKSIPTQRDPWDEYRPSLEPDFTFDMPYKNKAYGFSHYPFTLGLEVTFKAKPNVLRFESEENGDNFDKSGLVITQTFLFSPYQNKPYHEPSGGMAAARIHPIITTNFSSNKAFDKKKSQYAIVDAIRYDYYIHLTLDVLKTVTQEWITAVPMWATKYNETKGMGHPYGNSAGIFKDAEEVLQIGGTKEAIKSMGNNGGVEGAVFSAAEKPIPIEICAKGLDQGFPFVRGTEKETWDNIHWWGSHINPSTVISAPGAFHASHLHWRWGHGVRWTPMGDGDAPQFKGYLPNNPLIANKNSDGIQKRGALVDPNCWIQTIKFAIVYYLAKRAPDQQNDSLIHLCAENFEDLFVSDGEPSTIPLDKWKQFGDQTGGNLVLWLSIKKQVSVELERTQPTLDYYGLDVNDKNAWKRLTSTLNGSIFVHGVWFAHDFDPTGWIDKNDSRMGDNKPLHFPTKEKEIIKNRNWERY